MTGMLVCLTSAILGVDYGWRPLPDGGVEYIIQIEPHMLDSLHDGEGLTSALPPAAKIIRRYRIVAGTGELPHHGEPLPEADEQNEAAAGAANSDEVSPVGYEEAMDRADLPGEVKSPSLSRMPLESPYPADYERVGVPLPGPASSPPVVAQDEAPPVLEGPRWRSPPPEEPEEFDAHSMSKPQILQAVAPEEESSPQLTITEADPPANAKAESESTAEKPPTSRQKAASSEPAAKRVKTEAMEPPSPSDQSDESQPAAEAAAGKQNTTTLVGLFASLGGNVFLVWVASGQRNRYRALLRRSHEALAAASVNELPSHEDDAAPRWEPITESGGTKADSRNRGA